MAMQALGLDLVLGSAKAWLEGCCGGVMADVYRSVLAAGEIIFKTQNAPMHYRI